ncbi:hypothetical protein SBA5_290181 [Candidatus Sulfotelmatomonas gaucii]|uniref:Uncharacterized protein n=1 Tax=Candidatus Sulfuritelmatomonas gaucii TaxID=2043161 RepID=A0A2N9LAK1_9BACT|nr:hypothetical protein SBA5_290181 [Candidatus Sulfotelmatomonas gaucii]
MASLPSQPEFSCAGWEVEGLLRSTNNLTALRVEARGAGVQGPPFIPFGTTVLV